MTIYQIDEALLELLNSSVDPETGECTFDEEAFNALQMARDDKVKNIALFRKNEAAFVDDLDAEIDALKIRRDQHKRVVERMDKLLKYALNGEKFETPEVLVKFTKSEQTVIEDEKQFIDWAVIHNLKLLTIKPAPAATPNKAEIKKALKAGEKIPFASITPNVNVSVK